MHHGTITGWVGHFRNEYATPLVPAFVDMLPRSDTGAKKVLMQSWTARAGSSPHTISPVKMSFDPLGIFSKAADRAVSLPRHGQRVCRRVPNIRKMFYKKGDPKFVHIREIYMQKMFNHNNIHEHLNGELRQTAEFATSMQICRRCASDIVYHSFFRLYASLEDRTPVRRQADIVPEPGTDPVGWTPRSRS